MSSSLPTSLDAPTHNNAAAEVRPRLANLIYFDTTMWNILCDQSVDARKFQDALRRHGSLVVLGINAYAELVKSFFGRRPERGPQLISCLDQFLQAGTPVVDSWEKWLIEESRLVSGMIDRFSLFLGEREQSNIASWTKGLLIHEPPKELQKRLTTRKEQTRILSESAAKALASQPDILEDLRRVQPEDISVFLDQESSRPRAEALLARYLPQVFAANQESLPMQPEPLARALLSMKSHRAAHAIVRVNIYRNWRAARSPKVTFAKCVPEDSYHVANACYCDTFVTEDTDGQADAAIHAIQGIKTLVYRDRHISVADWLLKSLL
jgi:hypothetical protein